MIDKLESIAGSGADLVTLWRETGPLLAEAVPHFGAACFFTVDPSSLLTTSHFQEGLPEIPGEWLGREHAEGDFNSMREVLQSSRGVGTLHDATGGRPELSRKFHEEMEPFGCDQELLFALRTPDGEAWGLVGLYRETGQPKFSSQDIELVRRAAPRLAVGARHGLLLGRHGSPTFRRLRVWSFSTSGSLSNRRHPRRLDGLPTWAGPSRHHRQACSSSRGKY